MKKVKVAVLGYGHLGKWHAQKVVANENLAEFVAIVEKFSSAQETARANHPGVKIAHDLEEIINDIDAAFVVTPTSTHFELVKHLLDHGKHVFCEKPLCSNDDEGRQIQELARKKKLVIQVGHSERFHLAWEKLKPKLEKLSPPYIIRINRIAPFKGRATDVDVLQDLAIHDLDLISFLFKEKPISLKASGFKIRTNQWDHAHINLTMENNCEAHIVVGRNGVKEIRELEIISSKGMILVDLFTNKIYEANSSCFEDGNFVREESYPKRDHLFLEHQFFYQSILENKPAVVGVKEGLRAVHLVDCCLNSLNSKQTVKVTFLE